MPDFRHLMHTARSPEHAAALLSRLTPRAADATSAVARDWMRRWTPARAAGVTAAAGCTCATGRCGYCN